jgi:glycogen debranching enzyme/glycosyltransferase involved in cell wall biosynthesis
MRIAQVAPLYESVPPKLYGGTERVVSYLTEELVRLGHEVTLFASGDSETSAKLVPACQSALWRDSECRETLPHHVRLMELVFGDVSRFDVIHFHTDYVQFPLLRRHACASVTTLHGLVHPPDLGALLAEYGDVPLVSISDSQRRPAPAANWQATVYHGLPRDLHTFRERPEGYLAFLGRISPEKRLDRAIEIARRSGHKLKVAARIYPEERVYFERTIQPLLEESRSFVEFLGEVGGADKDDFLGKARALLFPIDWAEPFGLVMIEALACGTPVIGWRCGSVPEIIEHGVTGFIVDSIDEAVRSVARVTELRRRSCRDAFEARFAAGTMAESYVSVYERLANSAHRVDFGNGRVAKREAGGQSGPHHVVARESVADERTRVLKHGDTFVVFDHAGDIKRGGLGEEGLYHESTRHLSFLQLELHGTRPLFLGSTIREENDQLAVAFTNPDVLLDGEVELPRGTLHVSVKKLLWRGACHQLFRVKNHGLQPVETSLTLRFQADFADIFEVSGMTRKARGTLLPPEVDNGSVTLRYRGLDGVERRTLIKVTPPRGSSLTASSATVKLWLAPQEESAFSVSVACQSEPPNAAVLDFEAAREAAETEREGAVSHAAQVSTSNEFANSWIRRAASDLSMMVTELPTGPYPYGGVPWFNTPFGRDGIITALECLWLRPEIARGVLSYLARTQATERIPEQDAEPGKILHETRSGEMAALGEMPFRQYYGAVDTTPLFVMLAGAYYERTEDKPFIESLWPHVEAALGWIDRDGDRDGDGFVEYERQSTEGLIHQAWKDSDDAVFHADGTLVSGSVASCEVQGYVYKAWRAAAMLASTLKQTEQAAELGRKAETLKQRFDRAFWCDDLSTYALALDGDKRPCRVRTSNAGQCLFTEIVAPERAARLAATLFSAESFSGWGIRTLATGEARHNPMGYHTGSVWPHDNALIARGLSRYGLIDNVLRIHTGLFEAGLHFDFHRMPELFCGFSRGPGEGPVPYPVACAPQAWSAASVFLLIEACLGLRIDASRREVRFERPRLPESVSELSISNLTVGPATVDLRLVPKNHGLGVDVLRCHGDAVVRVVE